MSKERFNRGRDGFMEGVVLRGATVALWSKQESQETLVTKLANVGRDTVGVLGMQALHVKVPKPAVPQYRVALGNEGNTVAGTRW
jgi:ABC-type xylose transport system substrate-binding protein